MLHDLGFSHKPQPLAKTIFEKFSKRCLTQGERSVDFGLLIGFALGVDSLSLDTSAN
jgi:hypothetical protein